MVSAEDTNFDDDSYIYVNGSYTGTDSDGSLDKPYISINSAVESSTNGGSIYIANGEYSQSEKITIGKDVSFSFIGESPNVVISNTGTNEFLNSIESGVNLVLKNLTFKNFNGPTSSAVIKIGGNGLVTIDNCNFYNCSGKYGAMQIYTSNMAKITNCNFVDVSCSKTGGAGAIYLSQGGQYNINNCNFENINGPSSGYMYGTIYMYGNAGTLYLNNSLFNNVVGVANSVLYNKGNLYADNVTIENCNIKSNSYGYQGDSLIYNTGELIMKNSVISNNVISKYVFEQGGNYIFNVSNSVITDNNAQSVIDGANYGTVSFDYNWWGSNDKPNDISKTWIVMSVEIVPSNNIKEGDTVSVIADFNKYYDSETGSINELASPVINGAAVEVSSNDGAISQNNLKAINGLAVTNYTAVVGYNNITVTSGNTSIKKSFVVEGAAEPGIYNLTNSTFFYYFDEYGNLLDNITEESTLNFLGEFSNLQNIQTISVGKKVVMNGINAIIKNIGFNLYGEGIVFSNMTLQASGVNEGFIYVLADDISLINNTIDIKGDEKTDIYGIYVDHANNVSISDNKIIFEGNGEKANSNFPIYANGANDLNIINNTFDSSLPSLDVGYDSLYQATPYSATIMISNSNRVDIKKNHIKTEANNAVGSYDTLYGIYIKAVNDLAISQNTIEVKGKKYGYAIHIGGSMDSSYKSLPCGDFNVSDNEIISVDDYYSNGIEIVGEATGLVSNNNISVKANDVVYGTNSYTMNGPVSVKYINNTIAALSNSVYGMEAMGTNETIVNNTLVLNGNFTLGIASGSRTICIQGNTIVSNGTGIGTPTGGDSFDSRNMGISLNKNSKATITNNTIKVPNGNYTVDASLSTKVNVVTGNSLEASSLTGDASVLKGSSTTVESNYPNYNGTVFVDISGSDLNRGSEDSPVATISKAIDIALANGGSKNIVVGSGIFKESQLKVSEDELTITGSGIGKTIIDAEYNGEIFNNYKGVLTLKNLTLANGQNTDTSGGAIVNIGDLTLDNVEITNSTSTQNGGAIYSVGNLKIVNSTIANNTASSNGGAVYLDKSSILGSESSLIIMDSDLSGNEAKSSTYGGGAIYMQNVAGEKTIVNTIFDSNHAYAGGAIFMQNSDGKFNVENSKFINNSATASSGNYKGGALCLIGSTYNVVGDVKVIGTIFANNTMAVYDRNVNLNISDSILLDNGNVSVSRSTTSYSSPAKVILEDNWWGNTDKNISFDNNLLDNTNMPSSWLILNMTGIKSKDNVNVSIDLTHNQKGIEINGEKLPQYIPVTLTTTNGTLLSNKNYLVNGIANTKVIMDCDNLTVSAEVFNRNVSLTFAKGKTSILVIDIPNFRVGEMGNITALIKDDNDDVIGIITIPFNATEAGNFTVPITYEGDYDYLPSSLNLTVDVAKGITTVNVTKVPELSVGESGDITADVKDANGNVIDTITVQFNATAAGNFTVPVIFDGNDNYEASSAVATVKVADLTYTLESSDVVKHFNNGTQYTVKVTDSKGNPVAGQTVALTLTNPAWKTPVTYYKVTDENGIATLPIGLYAGTYGITAAVGDDSVETTITVLPMTYSLESEDIYMTFRDGTNYTVTVIDADNNPAAGKTVAITISSPKWKGPVTYKKVTDENGIATLPIGLSAGKYDVTATFDGESASTTINVLKSAYKIETSDVVKYFNNGTQYTVTVRDLQNNPVEGKTVSVTVNSAKWKTPVTYNITTDEKGIATLPIGLVAGEYTISANVDGNIAENSITVLPVLTTESISKPVNQPASLLAKLVDSQGNPAAGKTVTFTVKTKSYDRLTDEKGIAALPIGLGIGKWTIMVSDPKTGTKTSATVTVTKAIT